MERHARQDAAKAASPYEKSRPVTVTLANAGSEPLKVRSELEIGRRLAFVLELIARGEVKAKMPEPSGRQKGSRNKRTHARAARRFQFSQHGIPPAKASIEGGAGDPSSQDCLSALL